MGCANDLVLKLGRMYPNVLLLTHRQGCSQLGADNDQTFRTLAGLDVLSQEPPEALNPLLSMPNVIVSPHSAFISHEALIELGAMCTKAIIDTLEGKVPDNILNPEVLTKNQ